MDESLDLACLDDKVYGCNDFRFLFFCLTKVKLHAYNEIDLCHLLHLINVFNNLFLKRKRFRVSSYCYTLF